MAKADHDAFSFKGLAAGIQVALRDSLADAANRLDDDEREQLEDFVNSADEDTDLNLLEAAERVLSMSITLDEEEVSFDADAVTGLALPNAFAPGITIDSLAAPAALSKNLMIGQITAYDPEQEAVSFSLVAGNPDLDGDGTPALQVNASSGWLSVADFGDLEFMDGNSLFPVVEAMDPDGLYSRKTIEVNLRDWSFQAGRPRDSIVITRTASEVTVVGAVLNAELLANGGQAPWRKGFEVSTYAGFEQDVVELESQSKGSTFSFRLWSLHFDTNYYYRSFIETAAGRSYGNKKRFRTKENSLELLLADAVSEGGGWWGTWFGYAYLAENGWMYHWDLGWVFATPLNADQVWLWFPELGWTWLTRSSYPYFYEYRGKRWLYLTAADAEMILFFDYNAKSLFRVNK